MRAGNKLVACMTRRARGARLHWITWAANTTMSASPSYAGWEPSEHDADVPRESAGISAQAMWEKYIQKRKPAAFDGLLDDDTWHGERLADLDYLRQQAGQAQVKVEPINTTKQMFGTAEKREAMTFAQFLDVVQDKRQGGKYYLTTQYEQEEEQGEDEDWPDMDPILPSPVHLLQKDFPLHPRILGNLVLQQCNLWVGGTQEPKSSGLHHDFHDNLYLLLSGYKRFILFPPTAYPYLRLRGHVEHLHKNGLLVYEPDHRIRADGLDEIDAAHWRVASRSHQNGKKRRNHAQHDVHGSYEEAKQALHEMRAKYDPEEDEDEDEEDGDDEEDGEVLQDPESDNDAFEQDEDAYEQLFESDEPPSFSYIAPSVLHEHFRIPSPIPAPKDVDKTMIPLQGCPKPLVVDLKPGQMLYVPASWFHEVTSYGSHGSPHIAFNYWMHPPDGQDAMEPYVDTEVWNTIRNRVILHNHN